MQIIDAHQHCWKFDPVRDSWITADMQAIRRDFLSADLQQVLQENNVAGCVAVQAVQSLEENRFLLQLAQETDFIRGVVGWVDLQSEQLEKQLSDCANFSKMKGFRHVLQGEPNRRLMLEPNFKKGICLLAQYGFTYDILIFSDQLAYAAELAATVPEQRFVLDHIGKPNIKQGVLTGWALDIRELAKNQNVWCKVSGMITEANWQNWTQSHFEPFLDTVFDAFGIERLMFGSDWPVCNLAGGYSAVKTILEQYLQRFNTNERSLFWGENTIKFYNL